jgi:hypothetical protein
MSLRQDVEKHKAKRAARRAARQAKFKAQCDKNLVQEMTCPGCGVHFKTHYEFCRHKRYVGGYYCNDGTLIDGEYVCPVSYKRQHEAMFGKGS